MRPEYRSLWNFRSGRPYVSNRARQDPRLVQEIVQAVGAESIVLVPMISEGEVLGLLVAANKPGGFTEPDVQLLTHLRGPGRLVPAQPAASSTPSGATPARLERVADAGGRHGGGGEPRRSSS